VTKKTKKKKKSPAGGGMASFLGLWIFY